MLISIRGERRDTLETDEFVIDCGEAVNPITGVLPTEFFLTQNYPNPFNPSTTMEFGLPRDAAVMISVYDILGREIERLVDERLPAGRYSTTWHCRDCATGLYIIAMRSEDFRIVRKAMLMR